MNAGISRYICRILGMHIYKRGDIWAHRKNLNFNIPSCVIVCVYMVIGVYTCISAGVSR